MTTPTRRRLQMIVSSPSKAHDHKGGAIDQIAVVNASTVVTDAALAAMVSAVQAQVDQHFAPAWGIPARLAFIPKGQRPPTDMWWIAVLDNADQAGALGYHDITTTGQPLGKVFAKTDLQYGYLVSVTLSHEVLEMLADPDVNLLVQDGHRSRRFWAYEVCDAVEADALGYQVNVTQVSDFVLPEYFETFRTGVKTDYLGHLTAPVPALTPGGYMAYVENGAWHQIYGHKSGGRAGEREVYRARPAPGARRYRRTLDRDEWLRSTVEI